MVGYGATRLTHPTASGHFPSFRATRDAFHHQQRNPDRAQRKSGADRPPTSRQPSRRVTLRSPAIRLGRGTWGRTEMPDLYQSFDLTNEFNILRIICGLFLVPHFVLKAKDLPGTVEVYRA